MIEREQGRGRYGEMADAEDVVASSKVSVESGEPAAKHEASEFERAMEIGRKVMSDHHAVLAALAK